MYKNNPAKFRVYVQTARGIIEHEFVTALDMSEYVTRLPDGTLYAFRLAEDGRPVDASELTMKRGKA